MESEMSTTSPAEVTAQLAGYPRATAGRSVWRHGVAVSVTAAAAVFAGTALTESLGVKFTDHTGGAIPLAGFPPVALVLSMLGVALVGVLTRRARPDPRPRRGRYLLPALWPPPGQRERPAQHPDRRHPRAAPPPRGEKTHLGPDRRRTQDHPAGPSSPGPCAPPSRLCPPSRTASPNRNCPCSADAPAQRSAGPAGRYAPRPRPGGTPWP